MPIPRMSIANTALLVIDVQERLIPTMKDRKRLVNNCAILLEMAHELEMPVIVTEQYVKGLGRTVPEVANAMPNPAARVEKLRFSGLVDMVDAQSRLCETSNVLVCGI